MNAIEVNNVTKVYRRYARRKQFATLKSALLKGSLIQDLQPDEKFPALQGVTFAVPQGSTYGVLGVLAAASVVFFAFIGFDVVATTAEEARNPQRDMPRAIIGSLAIVTVLYVAVASVAVSPSAEVVSAV